MLRPPRDGRLDARFLDLFVQDAHRIVDDFLARLPFLLHLPDQIRIRFRLQIVETEIFKLPFDIVNPQTMRERRVNFLRFLGDTNLLVAPEDGERAHIVQPVRQFDQHDADIFGHRQKHFPEIFQLLVFFVLVMKLRELRHAVHERGDFFSEKRLDIRKRMLRILHDIVQKRRRDARGVHLELRQNVGDGERMNDVRLPRLAFLRRVRLRRQRIRLLNHGQRVRIREVAFHARHQVLMRLFDLFCEILFARLRRFPLANQNLRQRRRRRIRLQRRFLVRRPPQLLLLCHLSHPLCKRYVSDISKSSFRLKRFIRRERPFGPSKSEIIPISKKTWMAACACSLLHESHLIKNGTVSA